MDHPLTHEEFRPLRKRMVHFLSNSLYTDRLSSIVFVCGGNKSRDMRTRFKKYCEKMKLDFQIFLPENAFYSTALSRLDEPFDLTDFENLAGNLSYAIVIFPEAPGSYAETGYFCTIENLAKKCLLVLDSRRQSSDSFISLGPAKLIGEKTAFHPNMLINYCSPNFKDIVCRLQERRDKTYRKSLSLSNFSGLSEYELAALLQRVIELFRISTISDINFILRAIFDSHISVSKVRKTLSILVACGYVDEIGDYGHYKRNVNLPPLTAVKDGHKGEETELRFSIAKVCQKGEPDFLTILEDNISAN